MKFRAPGKVVISGAYAVLQGAPAIVAAADRFVEADSERPAAFDAPEVRAAMALGYLSKAPFYDASGLRQGDRKLGLGSSAAILVACMAASGSYRLEVAEERQRLFLDARLAHQQAQGGGSGIDIAAATFGGFLGYQLVSSAGETAGPDPLDTPEAPEGYAVTTLSPPPELMLEVWGAPSAASTGDFVRRVLSALKNEPERLAPPFAGLHSGARRTFEACSSQNVTEFLEGLEAQQRCFVELTRGTGVPICTPALMELIPRARAENSIFLPAGAGGGDISIYASLSPSSETFRSAASALGQVPLPLALGATGVHQI